MIINAEHYRSIVKASKIRKKNSLNVILEATKKMNQLEEDDVLDSASTTLRVQFEAVWLLASSTHRTEQGHRVPPLVDSTNMTRA